MRAPALAVLLLWPVAATAQEPSPTPSASPTETPFPEQDRPPGDWRGYDEAIRTGEETPTPTPSATPDPFVDQQWKEHEEYMRQKEETWDPSRVFPGNYATLPLTIDVGFRPCLDCSPGVNLWDRPGELSLWAGYAFQPLTRTSSPFMAGGVEWIGGEWILGNDGEFDRTFRGRSQIRPTWRAGWNFTAASVYASGGVILPDRGRSKLGYHVGVGVSSIAMLAVSVCAAEAIPSVFEAGWDFEESLTTGRVEDRFVLKVGWGF